MTTDQILILGLLLATLAALAAHRWRHDAVAVTALLAAVGLGLVPAAEAFSGFANAAVVTVAAILVLGRTLVQSGALDPLVARIGSLPGGETGLVGALCGVAAFSSAFMNNVGALAMMMPVALAVAARRGLAPGKVLMPVSFATLLGGMTTLIGTPPNLLISQFREGAIGEPFAVFAFTPYAVPIALVGVAWLALVGWRLVPDRVPATDAPVYDVGRYQSELTVLPGSPMIGMALPDLPPSLDVHGVLRGGARVFARPGAIVVAAGDVLLVEASLATMERLAAEGSVAFGGLDDPSDFVEVVVTPSAVVLGSALNSLHADERWGVAVVAVARNGRRYEGRLADLTLAVGDVLLLQGPADQAFQAADDMACLPLARRPISITRRRPRMTVALFGLALAGAASGLVPPEIAFTAAVLALVLTGILPIGDVYRRIDWSVVVMLAALVPLGGALAETGAAAALAHTALELAHGAGFTALLAMTFVFTVLVTPVLNNVATVIVVAPIVVSLANQAGLPVDPFLIIVAIGASADFLTPFGHHNNTIIMGPGGYRFGDYWRPGLPLVVLTGVVAVLMLGW
jgi:di/tricarboxylate transporter